MLTFDEAIEYWDRRHQREDRLRSGGDIDLSPEANEIFYAMRLGKLLGLVGDRTDARVPLFTLDAGCGKGYFSEALQRCGHRVTGIDASASAIEHCRRIGEADYHHSTLDAYTGQWLYDVVYSVDVLFHILDDAVWERSMVNLASHVRLGGKLIVTDLASTSRVPMGDHVLHRPHDAYLDVLRTRGFELAGFEPYRFQGNGIGFYCFVRKG